MTRLTDNDVKSISDTLGELEKFLLEKTGRTIKKVACEAVGMWEYAIDTKEYTVAVVPVTSGLGVISNFSESVRDVCKWLGMDAYVTETTDVTGLAEAITKQPDIIMMADDYEFIAYNLKMKKYADNSMCTAKGYIAALDGACDSVIKKEVLVVGAGRVGSRAAKLLLARGAKVTITDVDVEKAYAVQKDNPAAKVAEDVAEAIRNADLIINASPAHIDTENIREGAIISSPGVPHTFDEAAYAKAKTIIHDPLVIGTAVMVMQAAYFSYLGCRK
ncbi:MAG: 3-methylornithyl-N6-L-lysine dehydrogenase PylD [archaeon]|nr:3-methylornithyl-N6-L-lysine dehydrogenase PylD [archaeon]